MDRHSTIALAITPRSAVSVPQVEALTCPKKPQAQKQWEARQAERARHQVTMSRPITIPPAKRLDDSWRFD
jgi:hypothetical protein